MNELGFPTVLSGRFSDGVFSLDPKIFFCNDDPLINFKAIVLPSYTQAKQGCSFHFFTQI